MRTLFYAPLLCLALSACEGPNNISGQLTLTKKINVRTPGGNTHALKPARYKSTVQMKSDGALVFIETGGGSISFKVPGVVENGQGKVSIPASRLGQEFGLQGKISTLSTPFARTVNIHCVWDTRTDYRCRTNRQGERECEWEETEIPGTIRERQVGVEETKSVVFDLIARGNSKAGQFKGSYALGETIHSREQLSGCERSRW